MRWDRYGQLKPALESFQYGGRSGLLRGCPFSPHAKDETALALERFPVAKHDDPVIGRFEAAYVGHAADGDFRRTGSSGGMVSWVAGELLRAGLVDGVAHVVPVADPQQEGRFFQYRLSRSEDEVRAGAKSRYYPVEMSGIIRAMRAVPGRYAVIGIPCFIKALHLLCETDAVLKERLAFTLGLYCGHMKSARFVESIAWQMGVPVEEIERIEYRRKNPDRPANWYTAELILKDGSARTRDWWHLVDGDWGAGFFQNSACDFCDDVIADVADISFGDAWIEPYASDGRGTNVIVVRSAVLHALLRSGIASGRLVLQAVDARFVEQTQQAAFRHRREGLAYRLSWRRSHFRPRKRVAPQRHGLSIRRKLVYRARHHIAAWSHRLFFLAKLTGLPRLYTAWARAWLSLYQALTYSRGRLGTLIDRIEASPGGTLRKVRARK